MITKSKIIFFCFLVLVLSCFGVFMSYAQTADDLRNKIGDRNIEIQKLEEEINTFNKQIDALGKESNTLSRTIKELDLNKKKLSTDIKVTENKISLKNLQIQDLSTNIDSKEGRITVNRSALAQSIKKINEIGLDSTFEVILSQNRFTDVWNQVEELKAVDTEIQTKIGELREIKKGLENDRDIAEEAKNELLELKSQLDDQKKLIDQNISEKNTLLKQTKNQESNYKKLVDEKLRKKKEFEDELRDYESQLKFILDQKSLPGKGVLGWPTDNVYITQLFGRTVAAKRLYASGSHSGVDFRASEGTPVKAVADGVVLGTGNTDLTCPRGSFGKWVFIKHNNGLSTTYAHLSLIKATQGEVISRGQVIGYSGNTGHSTAPHLHLTVYASAGASVVERPSKACGGKIYTMPVGAINAYLDPLEYLPSYTASMVKPDL
ncbi:MAG: Peptidase, M23/M37 family [Candidatus Nomurabacteria bacterium GW2011_GWB1_37_5]|uniref:Peptidase, M23/M37 family n=1 Tax=Candidatus Nomurabacteria bacterium GW2011_GWB1_37_5 TaxID=1618742 RepID=A0A0G0K3M4_9BACT|nr:MAG: Peptidase, M23/M37 family [Candidatus Nomurabacteria bacterium GW2011_GWB1_37_5]